MSIADIIQRDVATCRPETSIAEAARAMREHEVGCLVVVDDGGRVTGIVTDRDIVLRAVANEIHPHEPVGRVVTHDPVTAHADIRLEDAARHMAMRGCRRLPVVAGDDRLIGVVTLDDVLLAAGQTFEDLVRLLRLERHEHERVAPLYRRQAA
jgi:CBS domain-containing protein